LKSVSFLTYLNEELFESTEREKRKLIKWREEKINKMDA